MPYVVPTPAEFKTRFPIFTDSDDALIQMLLNEAATNVSTSWIESDYQPAILYLTAHLLATDNSEEGADVGSGVGGDGQGQIASEHWGPISISYRAPQYPRLGESFFDQYYGTTSYGRRYLFLIRRNFPAIAVV